MIEDVHTSFSSNFKISQRVQKDHLIKNQHGRGKIVVRGDEPLFVTGIASSKGGLNGMLFL
jgi:hypothetical protein